MDIKRPNATFVPRLPYCVLTEDVEKIAIMKAVLRSFTDEHESNLLSLQRRLKDGQKKIEICTRQSNEIYLELNTVETKIREALLLTQEKESEALQTVKENGSLKRQIVDLKNDVEEQGRIINRTTETMEAIARSYVARNNKKLKVLPDAQT